MPPKELFPGGSVTKAICQTGYFVAEILIHPYQTSLSSLLSLFLPTTVEKEKEFTRFVLQACLWTIPYLVLNILTIPLALIGGILRISLKSVRSKYIYKHNSAVAESKYKTEYTITSINTCLFHEVANRFNNLVDSLGRAKNIGERIVIDQYHYTDLEVDRKDLQNGCDVNARINHHFPHLDFVCFQEIWQRTYARPLIAELEKVYPYIVYDPGHWSLDCNYFLFNSGLMFASRYEILDVDFKPFSHKCNFCVVNSKGLLMVKVLLNTKPDSERYVGYIYLTHLQAYQGEKQVIDKQLDEILTWTEEFRSNTLLSTDKVKFDFLCGDFNFDNMSPCDKDLHEHRLFDVYDDPCRERAGLDKPWTVGTEFRQNRLWDKEISTPEGLESVLKDPIQRQRFMVDADIKISNIDAIVNDEGKFDEHGNVILSPVGGRRRVDYAMLRKDCGRSTKFKFISRLASLTDHIPVTLTVEVD